MDINYYKTQLNELEFTKLEKEFMQKPINEVEDILNMLAYDPVNDENNLLVYTFLQYLIIKQESSELHLLTSKLMAVTLNHVDKAELIGLYHGLQASKLDPDNIDILEYLLYFNQIPEKLLNDTTAITFAKTIIDKRPESLVAKMRLGLI